MAHKRPSKRHLFHFTPQTMVNNELSSFRKGVEFIKPKFEKFLSKLESPIPFVYTFPFLTEDFCRDLIWLADTVDRYHGWEIKVNELSPHLYDVMVRAFGLYIVPIVSAVYADTQLNHMEPPLVTRLEKEIPEHFDTQSHLSVHVPLKSGGGIHFPKYGEWTGEQLSVGHAVIYPSLLTHSHRLITNSKWYSLEVWTRVVKQYEGEE